MHIQKVIERLGYSAPEARVYLAALRAGPSKVSDLAEKLDMPRTSVQALVERLGHDGLMNFFIQRRYKYWSAEDPQKFLIRLKENEAALQAVMPELATLRHKVGGKPTVKVFTGVHDMKFILEDIIAAKHHVKGIVAWDRWFALERKEVKDFIEMRVRNSLHCSLLVPKTPSSAKLKQRDAKELRQVRFLPPSFVVENVVFIYGSKVAFITLNEKRPTAVLIDATDIRDMMLMFFDDIWNRCGQ